MEGTTRIHLNTERWRACEPWFSPGMAGIDCAGLGEVIHNILSGFSEHERARLANVSIPCLSWSKDLSLKLCIHRMSSLLVDRLT